MVFSHIAVSIWIHVPLRNREVRDDVFVTGVVDDTSIPEPEKDANKMMLVPTSRQNELQLR